MGLEERDIVALYLHAYPEARERYRLIIQTLFGAGLITGAQVNDFIQWLEIGEKE